MHWIVFYETRLIYIRTDFLLQKDANVLFEIDMKDRKNTANVHSTAPFYKLFLKEQPYSFELPVR
jgi:hypothetical protein